MAQTAVNNKTDMQKDAPKKSNAGAVVFVIILIAVIAGAAACYWFNVFGVKTKVLTLMGKEVPAEGEVIEKTEEEIRAENEAYYAQLQAGIDTQKAELEQKEAELIAKENDINEREQRYLVDKAEFDSLYEAFEHRKADVKDVAKIYEQMDSSTAAEILTKYADMNEVARIVSNLTDSKAAEVLSEMDPKYASDLLRVID